MGLIQTRTYANTFATILKFMHLSQMNIQISKANVIETSLVAKKLLSINDKKDKTHQHF